VFLNTSTITQSGIYLDVASSNQTLNTNLYTGDGVSSLIWWGTQLSECALIPPPSGGIYQNTNLAGANLDDANTFTVNTTLSPDCATPNDASTFTEGTGNSGHEIGNGPVIYNFSGVSVTETVYVGGGSGDRNVEIDILDNTFTYFSSIQLDPSTCTLVAGPYTTFSGASVSDTLTPVGPGMCKVTLTTNPITATALYLNVELLVPPTNGSYTGNGTSNVTLWGLQITSP
jgi:hypothetical protein